MTHQSRSRAGIVSWRGARVPALVAAITALMTACQEVGDSVNAALARSSQPEATADRLQQQLGELPSVLDTTSAARLSGAFRAAAAHALPAVVHITTIAMTDASTPLLPSLHPDITPQRTQGSGSGFIIDESGHILTNHHVVANALQVNVMLLDGREFTAEVIGADPNTDIAVIRVDAGDETLPLSTLGDSDQLRVGDWVLALGNPMGLTFTATAGIVSAKGRQLGIIERSAGQTALEAFIQTDAAINPGNSGGPLVDLNGRVVGINTAIESMTGYFTGAGFAIPIDLARKFADDIVRYGVVHRPRLGVSIQDVNAADAEVYSLPSISGVEVISVSSGTPADRAGLQLGDVIVTLNGETVNTVSDLQARVARFQPGDRVDVGYIRYGARRQATVQLGEFETAPQRQAREQPDRAANPLGFNVTALPAQMAARLGLRGENIPVVASIDPLGPARPAGLGRGHVIRKFNGRDVRNIRELERAASAVRSGDIVSLIVLDATSEAPAPTIINFRVQ
jgi:serine protease Do